MKIKQKGYIHVYTGNGKGKTTAAIGIAMRAIGAGKKVFFAQFVKGMAYSEVKTMEHFAPNITVKQYGLNCFIYNAPTQADIDAAQKGFKEVTDIILSETYDMVVLDEANIAIYYQLLSVNELLDLLKRKPKSTEIIITGRYARKELIDFADLVSEVKEVKHYYTKGIEARKGIEY